MANAANLCAGLAFEHPEDAAAVALLVRLVLGLLAQLDERGALVVLPEHFRGCRAGLLTLGEVLLDEDEGCFLLLAQRGGCGQRRGVSLCCKGAETSRRRDLAKTIKDKQLV